MRQYHVQRLGEQGWRNIRDDNNGVHITEEDAIQAASLHGALTFPDSFRIVVVVIYPVHIITLHTNVTKVYTDSTEELIDLPAHPLNRGQ